MDPLGTLRLLALLLPGAAQKDWLDTWRGDLATIPSSRKRVQYRLSQARGVLVLA